MKLFFAALLTLLALLPSALRAQPSGEFAVVVPEALEWRPVPDGLGATFALLHGNPGEPGTYVIRVRFPAGVMDAPHYHSKDRHVTVLEGNWHAGTGGKFSAGSADALGPGAYMYHPAGALHWDGAAGEHDAVVQIIGQGPVSTTPADPDAPFWIRVR